MPAHIEKAEDRQAQLSFKYDPNAGMTHFFQAPGVKQLEAQKDLINMGKGIAIGPFTMAPDMIGLMQKIATPPALRGLYESGEKQYMSGDPLRETIGLDPESGWGMVGEALGGWENALAKGGATAVKMFAAAMEHAPDITMAGIAGLRAARTAEAAGNPTYMRRLTEAKELEQKGLSPAAITARTGWWKRGDDWQMYISDANTKIKEDVIRSQARGKELDVGEYGQIRGKFSDYVESPDIFQAYPELMDYPFAISIKRVDDVDGMPAFLISDKNQQGRGAFSKNTKEGFIYNTGEMTMDDALSTAVHEMMGHAVQDIEKFAGGVDSKMFIDTANEYAEARIKYRMIEDYDEGIGPGDNALLGENDIEDYLREFVEQNGVELDEQGQVWSALKDTAYELNLHDPHEITALRLQIIDEALDAERIAQWQLRLANEDPDMFLDTLDGMTDKEVYRRALVRYAAEEGEVNARIGQMFQQNDQAQMDRLIRAKGDPQEWASRYLKEFPTEPDAIVSGRPDFPPDMLARMDEGRVADEYVEGSN